MRTDNIVLENKSPESERCLTVWSAVRARAIVAISTADCHASALRRKLLRRVTSERMSRTGHLWAPTSIARSRYTLSWPEAVLSVAHDHRRNGWCGLELSPRFSWSGFVVDQYHHPYTNSSSVAEEWCTMNPSASTITLAIIVWSCEPSNLRGNASSFGECLYKLVTNTR